ncbi:MAG: hypothetical protein PVI07_08775, partial [Anaerolineae bacterium]
AAANDVTRAIKDLVDETLDSHPSIRYLVIVGGDEVLPFRRVPDQVAIANESTYRRGAGVARETPLYYSLAEGYTLSDDFYADREPFAWFGRQLYLPDYAIGRLVEMPQEMVKLIDVYLTRGGQASPETGLVVGYDFLADSAREIKGRLEEMGIGTSSLISDTWTADELRAALLATRHDLNAVNAHFQHWRAWPADIESGQLTSDDVVGASADLSGALLFSLGCHAGLNVPDAWDDAGSALDFSQAFARSGSTWVGNTGYGYGMDEAAALSERLMGDFVAELGTSSEVAVGEALVRAKQRYVNSVAAGSLGLYDEKILVETTLYGLPMARVSVPSPTASTSSVQAQAVASSPVAITDGLLRRTITVTAAFSAVTTPDGRYYSVDHEVQASGGRPIQPRVSRDIAEAGTKARSVLFLGGDYRDIAPFDPLIARPVTDTAMTEPSFTLQGWYPTEMAAINRVETAFVTLERLVLVPGQFRNPGTERLWDRLTYDVYYSTDDDAVDPTIWRVEAGQLPNRATFRVETTDDSGIERVVVAYSLGAGEWRTIDLAEDAGADTWFGELALDEGESVGYFVQAVDGAGNVASSDNKGFYFEPVTHEVYLPLALRNG